MFRLLKALPLTLALAALSIFATSCGSSSQSQVRVVHAIPDAPPLDVDINGTKITTAPLAFGGFQPASGYTKVSSGSVTIQAFDTGTTINPIFGTNGVTASLSGSSQYTIVLAGFLTGTGTNALAALQITDNNSAPTSGNVEFRIIHASPSSPGTVDVFIVPPGTDITSPDVTPRISGLTYQQASNPYTSLAAGTYSVIVTTSGTKQPPIISQDFALPTPGMIRTLVLVDNPGGGNPPSWLELVDLN
jgi:Domain of unknown function (DUF4397)